MKMLNYLVNALYFIFGAGALGYGIGTLIKGRASVWTGVVIVLIGLYFLYRGIAKAVNESHRRQREREGLQ